MSDETTVNGRGLFTPFNVIAGIIVIVGLIITALRFTRGLSTVTNLSDYKNIGVFLNFCNFRCCN